MSCGVGHRRTSDLAVAVAKAGSYSSDSTPSLGTSFAAGKEGKTKMDFYLARDMNELLLTHKTTGMHP